MSVPALGGDKAIWPAPLLVHPLRMADRLMAAPTDGYQVPLPDTVLVGVVTAESELRVFLDVFDMMHQLRSVRPAADLAVPMIVLEDGCGQLPPFPADVERVNISGGEQGQEPIKKTLSHGQQKKMPVPSIASLRYKAQAPRHRH